MKSYKLIKEYPGSPKLDTIFEYWTDGISEQIYNKSNNPSFFPLKIVTDYPEFWEEVVEKDYEILSLFETCEKYIISEVDSEQDFIDELKVNSNVVIHSIKRLSDGQIFTISDKYQVLKPLKEIRTIDSFHLSNNTLVIHPKEFGYSMLSEIYPIKKPLFTTEDGVDIFEGDEYFTVRDRDFSISCDGNGFKSKGKHFSTKQAAEDYVLMNVPKLSIKDILSISGSIIPVSSLKQLVKSKL